MHSTPLPRASGNGRATDWTGIINQFSATSTASGPNPGTPRQVYQENSDPICGGCEPTSPTNAFRHQRSNSLDIDIQHISRDGARKRHPSTGASRDSGIGSSGGRHLMKDISVCNIPFSKKWYTGRDVVMKQIREETVENQSPRTFRRGSTVVLHGIGGIGKTTVAAAHGFEHQEKHYFNGVFFVDCSTCTSFCLNIANLGHLLDLEGVSENTSKQNFHKVTKWFRSVGNWLLILDNADDKSIIQLLSSTIIPDGHRLKGDIIITSRSDVNAQYIDADLKIEVQEFLPHESKNFLLHRTSSSEASTNGFALEEIVHLAGGHPLKLEQIGSYLYETRRSFESYLAQVTEKGSFPLSRVCSGDRSKTLESTFELNFTEVEKSNQYAMDILIYASLMSHAKIPFLFYRQTEVCLGLPDASCEDMYELLRVARSYSLLKFAPNVNGFTIHSVIQEQILQRLSKQRKEGYAYRLMKALYEIFQDDQIDSKLKRDILPHAHSFMKKCWNTLHQDGLLVLPRTPELSIRLGLTLLKVSQTYATLGIFDTAKKMVDSVENEVFPELQKYEALFKYLRAETRCQLALLNLWTAQGFGEGNAGVAAERNITGAVYDISDSRTYLRNGDVHMRYLIGNNRLEIKRMEILKWRAYVNIEKGDTADVEETLTKALDIAEDVGLQNMSKGLQILRQRQLVHIKSMFGRFYKLLSMRSYFRSPSDSDEWLVHLNKSLQYYRSAFAECDADDNRRPLFKSQVVKVKIMVDSYTGPVMEAHEYSPGILEALRECRFEAEGNLGPNDRYVGYIRRKISWFLYQMKDYDEALLEIDACLDILVKAFHCEENEYPTKLAYTFSLKGQILTALEKYEEALVWLNKGKRIYETSGTMNNPNIVSVRKYIHTCYEAL